MSISNPHDRYFREIFSDPDVVQDLLRNYLPPAAVETLDLTTLTLQQDSFVDEELRQHYTDLLYTVQQQSGAPAHVYILLEHKSYADRLTSFQLLRYLVRVWETVAKTEPGDHLPPIATAGTIETTVTGVVQPHGHGSGGSPAAVPVHG